MPGQVVPLRADQPWSTDELEREINLLAARIHAATCELLLLIAEFDARSGWINTGMRSCAHWLNWKCGISLGAAREKVRVASSLAVLPEIRTAFARGELSSSKVRAMTRIATPDNEDTLMNIARHGTATHVEKLVRYYRRMSEGDAIENANRQHANRSLHYFTDDDGSLVIKGQLPAEVGAVVVKAIEAAMDAIHANSTTDRADVKNAHPEPAETVTETRRHDARLSLNMLQGGAENVPAGTSDEPVEARRADAFALMAESFLATGPNTGHSAERYQVVVHMATDGCDASVVRITEDPAGNPLHVERKTRSISPALRRALQSRDRGCRFPGCTARRFVDGHHIRHWADGGATNIDNLVLLCRHHHRLVHEGGFSVWAVASGHPVFARPDGMPIVECGRAEFGKLESGRCGRLPDAIGPRTFWDGGSMDYDVALDTLTRRARQPAHTGWSIITSP